MAPRSSRDLLPTELQSFFTVLVPWIRSYPYPPFTTLIIVIYSVLGVPQPGCPPLFVASTTVRSPIGPAHSLTDAEARRLSRDAMQQAEMPLIWLADTAMPLLSLWTTDNQRSSRAFADGGR